MRRWWAAGLAGLVLVLAGTVMAELSGPGEQVAVLKPLPVEAALPAGAVPTADRTPRWAATILARPLFSPSRRPAAQHVAGPAGPPTLPRLTAVLVGEDGRRAIFAGTGPAIVAREGSRIGDHLVQTIAAGEVTLQGPEGSVVLRPRFLASTAPVPATPGSAASTQGVPSLLDRLRKSSELGAAALAPPSPTEGAPDK
jgi:hypothetical protein